VRTCLLALSVLLVASWSASAAERVTAEDVGKRVGQVFVGYDDFYVWVTQTEYAPGATVGVSDEGRAYFKRKEKFRLNFGKPPREVHGTDGQVYWIYKTPKGGKPELLFTRRKENAPAHPLLLVFALGDKMAKAMEKFFNAEPVEEAVIKDRTGKEAACFRLTITLKPEFFKKFRQEVGDRRLLPADPRQKWTIWVDKSTWLPRRVLIGRQTGARSEYSFRQFHHNVGLRDAIFDMPRPLGVEPREIDGGK